MKKFSLILIAGLVFAGCGEMRKNLGIDDSRRDLNQARGELNELKALLAASQLQIAQLTQQISDLDQNNAQALADLQLEIYNANLELQALSDLIINGLPTASALLIKNRIDWNNPVDTPLINTDYQANIGRYQLIAMEANLSLRAIKVTTSVPLPYLLVNAFNDKVLYSTGGSSYTPGTEFLVQADFSMELSFMEKFGDNTSLSFFTDTSALDGQDVTFEIEYVLVSVDGAPEVQVTEDLPLASALRIAEFPQLAFTATNVRTETIGTDTIITQFDVTDLLASRPIVIPAFEYVDYFNTMLGVTNVTVEGHLTSATEGYFVKLQLDAGDEIIIQPGQTLSIVVRADTTAKTPGDVISLQGSLLEAHPEGETLNFPPVMWQFYQVWHETTLE